MESSTSYSWERKRLPPKQTSGNEKQQREIATSLSYAQHAVLPPNQTAVKTLLCDRKPSIIALPGPGSDSVQALQLQFLCSDQEVLEMLDSLTTQQQDAGQDADIVLLNSEDGLERDNLVQRLTVYTLGKYQRVPGRLFNNPVTLILVLDIRHMTAGQIATFNDLLDPDKPALYQPQTRSKQALGPHVQIRVLAHPNQLKRMGSSTTDAPGADFWGRVNRWPGKILTAQQFEADDSAMEVGHKPLLPTYSLDAPLETETAPPVTINLHLHNDWRRALFGGTGIDDKGCIRHIPGQLEQLQPGQTVILKGGDWSDLVFHQQIRSLLDKREYQSNGQTRTLPEAIQFYRADVGDHELAKLLATTVNLVTTPSKKPIVVNQSTLSQWLTPIKINRLGCTVPNTALQEQISAGGTVTVTSPLSPAMWFLLLHQLQGIAQERQEQPQLFLTDPHQQPEQLQLPEDIYAESYGGLGGRAVAVTYQNKQQVTDCLRVDDSGYLEIQITDRTHLGQLFDNLHIQSEKPPRFGRQSTELQTALDQGREVVFRGLESNPVLQQALESLNSPQPSVIINGLVRHYPKANIRFFWPQGRLCHAPLWQSAIASAEPLPETDIWHGAANRNGLDHDAIPKAALESLYKCFDHIPKRVTQKLGKLPALTGDLLDNLIIAARQAQERDYAQTLEPKHWRKAINSVLTHFTRQEPAVRDFTKVVCEQLLPDPEQHWVDPERLADTLSTFKTLDQTTVQENFWQLARAVGPGFFAGVCFNFNSPIDDSFTKQLEKMYALLAAHASSDLRQCLINQLQPNPLLVEQYGQYTQRSSLHRKRLEDALASGWGINNGVLANGHKDLTALADRCYALAKHSALDGVEQKTLIMEQLTQALVWHGSVPAPLEELADDLLHARTNQADREQRRLSRLKQRLAHAPVIFIEGETATGKSYGAAQTAHSSGPAFITSLGPATDDQDLVQRWRWREDVQADDRSMVRVDQILLQWAKTMPKDGDDYVTLVLDEANLSQESLLACLKGLWNKPPCIYVDGQPLEVTDRHRIILTGNPGSYGGRGLDDELLAKIQRIHYPPLNRAFLHDRVVVPNLLQQLAPHIPGPEREQIAGQTATGIMTLWQHYQTVLPDHKFTPRDLTDICAWLGWYLNQLNVSADAIGQPHINGLVWQSFRDVLAAEVNQEQQGAAFALESWFTARYPMDNTLLTKAQDTLLLAWEQFQKTIAQSKPYFDSSSSAVATLVEALSQDLLRCQQAYSKSCAHGGRQATIIEGPTGRGKDVTLQLTIASIEQWLNDSGQTMPRVHYLNACDCPWDTLRGHIQEARLKGEIVVISELNLIDSQHLEGELNAILAGAAAPGFHLFATTNPPDYSGRKPMSPALKGRFRYLPIRQYSQNELTSIAKKVLPDTLEGQQYAAHVADLHCRLRHHLQKQDIPLQPVSGDLQKLCLALVAQNSGPEAIPTLFNHHYKLYLLATGQAVEKLPAATTDGVKQHGCDHSLSLWLNQTLTSLSSPWQVQRSEISSINAHTHVITVPNHLGQEQARAEVIKHLAQHQWCQSGLPLTAPEPTNTLKQALYRRWQQHWFATVYQATGIEAAQVFPLHELELAALALEVNQSYLAEVEKVVASIDVNRTILWPAYWRQVENILNRPLSHQQSAQHQQPVQHEQPDAQQPIARPNQKIKTLDTRTDYQQQASSQCPCTQYFQGDRHDPRMVRLGVYDLEQTDDGDLSILPIEPGKYGLETVCPGALPKEGPITLADDHYYGIFSLTTGDSQQWHLLPGLTPHDTMLALGTDPETRVKVVKDSYSGLHMICCLDAPSGQNIDVHYVLASKTTPKSAASLPKAGRPSDRPDANCSRQIRRQVSRLFKPRAPLPYQQQQELRQIKQASEPATRVRYITKYCRNFQGQFAPHGSNLLDFLLRERQGSCRHRTVAFVALCRYFNIPARIVDNKQHRFPEYSLDNGITWQAEDLGGSDKKRRVMVAPAFRETKPGQALTIGTNNPKMVQVLRQMNPRQMEALAEIIGINPQQLRQWIASGMALPMTQPAPGITQIIEKLWEEKTDRDTFTLGCQLLNCSATDIQAKKKVRWRNNSVDSQALIRAARSFVCPGGSIDVLLRELPQLHQTWIKHTEIFTQGWQTSMIRILRFAIDTHGTQLPQAIALAQTAFAQEWLSPDQLSKYQFTSQHTLFDELRQVDALKPRAERTLRQLYKQSLSNAREDYVVRNILAASINLDLPTQYRGHSRSLETALKANNLSRSWTEEPDGEAPDMERLLIGAPAFRKRNLRKARHRPVILLDTPQWNKTALFEKTDQLCEQYWATHADDSILFEPYKHDLQTLWDIYLPWLDTTKQKNIDRLRSIQTKYCNAIRTAFAHYLYQQINSRGGQLIFCWASGCIQSRRYQREQDYGHIVPESPAELAALILTITSYGSAVKELNHRILKKAFRVDDALILGQQEITVFAQEFLNTFALDPDSVSIPAEGDDF